MPNIAPDIFRKRLLIEGYYTIEIAEETIKNFFSYITGELSLKTYGEPIVHTTSGVGKESNQGYDAFVPLIDSGIYMGVWANQKFLSLIIYTCKDFNERDAFEKKKTFFQLSQSEHKLF
jgi:S-adenosylmethionine decarboxylase